ncbi:MAG: hypothetical protein Kow00127_25080 [Bacteroidales bacterium]
MELIKTWEIRWFFKGALPQEWVDLLNSAFAGTRRIEQKRTDVYLNTSDRLTGIKLREGRLEIKQAVPGSTMGIECRGMSGKAAIWKKWGFISSEGEFSLPHDPAHWTEVRKERILWLAEYHFPGKGRPVHPTGTTGVELTGLSTGGAEFWTFGIETIIHDTMKIPDNPCFFIPDFQIPDHPPLTPEASMSYPAWLCSLSKL